jgi:phosphate-selective porin OprO/OprP
MKHITLASAATLLVVPAASHAQEVTDETSSIDSILPADNAPAAEAPRPTGDPVLDRLNALEARIRQLETRNAELEQQASQTQTRVENVEVRAAKAAQPGVVPAFSDVNGDFTFKPRGVLQIDYAAYNERAGGYDFSNGTDIRRARFGFEGTAFKKFKWRLDAELIKQQVNLLDAYISYALSPRFTLTAGQHKTPYGLEANTSDANNTFLERSLASNAFGAVGAERRIGLSLAYTTDRLNATMGVFGAGEAITRNAASRDEPYGVNGRLTWEPILDTGRVVHLGVSGYHVTNLAANGVTIADRPNARVDGGSLISVALTGTAPQGGAQTGVKAADYVGAEGAVVFGPFSVQGEYGALALDRYGSASTLDFSGFNIFGSFFVTGESRSFKGGNVDKLKPFNDFNPGDGHWGAVEIAARYDQLDLTDPALALPTSLIPANPGGRKAHSWTGAVNWYLNPNLRAAFNYVRFFGRNSALVTPSAVAGTAKGDIFATRLQLDF